MEFLTAYATDIGIRKSTNQDSLCIKVVDTPIGQVSMLVICDGMGGLEKGELASAEVINKLSYWFDNKFSVEYRDVTWQELSEELTFLVKNESQRILDYGRNTGVTLGTTLTMMITIRNEYMIVHVGDSRVYKLTKRLEQLTKDQTFIAREIERGTMTPEEAAVDKRRNMLLQCVGASTNVDPEIVFGKLKSNESYLLCSDGFRHVLTEEEIFKAFEPKALDSEEQMEIKCRYMINQVMDRKERDNITVLVMKTI